VFQGGVVERRKLLRCQGHPVPEAAMLNLADLIDDAKCYECTPDAVGRENLLPEM